VASMVAFLRGIFYGGLDPYDTTHEPASVGSVSPEALGGVCLCAETIMYILCWYYTYMHTRRGILPTPKVTLSTPDQ
jgi:hypothetical protein